MMPLNSGYHMYSDIYCIATPVSRYVSYRSWAYLTTPSSLIEAAWRKYPSVNWPLLVQIMVSRQIGGNHKQTLYIFIEENTFAKWRQFRFGLIVLTNWGRGKVVAFLQTTFSNAFSWMKMHEFRLIFHWSMFLRVQLRIFQYWFR